MATAFDDVRPWPGAAPAAIGHNRAPIDETVVADFEEGLRRDGLTARIAQLVAKGNAAPDCDSEERAGRYGDFIKQCSAAEKAIDGEREKHNRPLLTAQRALKGRADAIGDPLRAASRVVRGKLDAYMAEQRRIADEKSREADRQAREAAEAAQRAAAERAAAAGPAEAAPEPEPLVEVKPVAVEAPTARGDYGARVGSTTVWLHEIESVRKLPDAILKHEKVVEAINKVIAAQVRGGTREMKGVRIWSEQRTAVR